AGGTFGGTRAQAGRARQPFVFRLWRRRPDSNRRPAVYKTAALPAELRRRAHRLYEGLCFQRGGVLYEVATVVCAGSRGLTVTWLTGTLSLRNVVTKVFRLGSHQVIK